MFIVSQHGRTIFTAHAFYEIELYRTLIEGVKPNGGRITLARYSCEELAELNFNSLKKAIKRGKKIFYFPKEAEEK